MNGLHKQLYQWAINHRSFWSMYFFHVTSHVPNLVKWFRTYFTMIWFFPTMKPSMNFKTRLCCEFFATLLTREGPPTVVIRQVLQTIVAVLWICTMLCFFKGMFTLECLFTNVVRERHCAALPCGLSNGPAFQNSFHTGGIGGSFLLREILKSVYSCKLLRQKSCHIFRMYFSSDSCALVFCVFLGFQCLKKHYCMYRICVPHLCHAFSCVS